MQRRGDGRTEEVRSGSGVVQTHNAQRRDDGAEESRGGSSVVKTRNAQRLVDGAEDVQMEINAIRC